MAVPAAAELTRLVKLLRMLESEAVGERAAAALKVVEWVRGHHTSWPELLEGALVPPVLSVGVGEAPPEAPVRAPGSPVTAPPGGGGKGGSGLGAAPGATSWAQQAANYARQAYYAQGLGQTPYAPGLGAGLGQTVQLPDWQAVGAAILAHFPSVLRGDKERLFIEGRLARAHFPLTAKQEAWLRDIASRAGLTW